MGQDCACAIINQENVCLNGHREGDCRPFTRVERLERRVLRRNRRCSEDFKPVRRPLHPCSHERRCGLAGQFVANFAGSIDSLEKARQNLDGIDED